MKGREVLFRKLEEMEIRLNPNLLRDKLKAGRMRSQEEDPEKG